MVGLGAAAARSAIEEVRAGLEAAIVGQPQLVSRLLIALLSEGHLLVEGAPGLAKTTAIKEMAAHLEGDFHRIQFTPDLLPADLIGTEVFRPQTGAFEFVPGPIFNNFILADEVNRAPAKVQSALLEAMAEQQVTVAGGTRPVPRPFLVMATQNPIEQEGTYPLPEAQLDRFSLYVTVDYPSQDSERRILELVRSRARRGPTAPVHRVALDVVESARREVLEIYLAPNLETYLLELVAASRSPDRYDPALGGTVRFGASPRGSLTLDRCARALAWLEGRDHVLPEDIQALAREALRHRLVLSYRALAEGVSADQVLERLLARVPVP